MNSTLDDEDIEDDTCNFEGSKFIIRIITQVFAVVKRINVFNALFTVKNNTDTAKLN